MKMKMVVTGGAGFIASHIADAYIARGHRVVVIDNLSTGSKRNVNPKAKFYKADIRNAALVGRIMKRERPDAVNHHAAEVSVVESVRNPQRTFEVNVIGTMNLIIAFGKSGKGRKKFIFASTGGAIYGEPKKIPASETAPALPLAPYGLSKFIAEEVVKFYAREYRLPYLNLRYSNVYGPRQNPKGEAGVVAIFAGLMRRDTRPTIFGNGTKTRDYVYVGDIVRANELALRRGENETVNLGSGKEISDQEVFDAIARCLNFRKSPRYAPFRPGEVKRISLDARRARKVLGWTPKISFAQGIRRTV